MIDSSLIACPFAGIRHFTSDIRLLIRSYDGWRRYLFSTFLYGQAYKQ